MNGFRITILTLLCLSVSLMFYAVLYVIPSWQDEYHTYQSSLRLSEYDKKSDLHRQQMNALDPASESPEETQARLAEEEAARKSEISLQEAEESRILAAAKRREEALQAQARAEEEAAQAAARAPQTTRESAIGLVASYDTEWNCIMIKPAVINAFAQGTTIAVRRNNLIICEAIVDGLDAESGQVSATVKIDQFGQAADAPTPAPIAGDEVIPSPFLSGDDLRNATAEPQIATPASELPEPLRYDTLNTADNSPHLSTSSAIPTPILPAAAEPALATPAPEPVPAAAEPTPASPALEPESHTPSAEPTPEVEPITPPAPEPEPTAPEQDTTPTKSNTSLPSLDAMLNTPLF